MVDSTQATGIDAGPVSTGSDPYDKRKVSYANTFTNPWKANTIRAMEWVTGKLPLLRLVRRFEALGYVEGQAFWGQALDVMGIELQTPLDQIANIPQDGPVIVVANHPHGLVDGMVLAELIGRVRTDYKILTRSLLTGVKEIDPFMIPVPFPHEPDSRAQSLNMRARAMDHLKAGGVIALFPSGAVASSEGWWGPAVEQVWNPFTAKMVQRSGATVVPIYFPGQNSRAYQIANRLSPTLRQGLLIHEVIHACGRAQKPVVGAAIPPEELRAFSGGQREFVAWLRERTLALQGT
ncbi:lysophospholipid acyltransferase family protein [Sagittula salina]|uniref:Lysophospholipid acyltransferase family protein n=1 Tax=Sagittula salina TaxID=2820268 RepID=A0A940MV12_9RHOB|nr:lysophospholipid acyltransferase family protein [Sagittula salina]MBP0483434.1 lysophospholipid acyltransferase family protein [Sagittula salina]